VGGHVGFLISPEYPGHILLLYTKFDRMIYASSFLAVHPKNAKNIWNKIVGAL
jgi:hypothetical protein